MFNSNVQPYAGAFATKAGAAVLPAPGVLYSHGLPPKFRELRADGAGHHVRPTASPKRLDYAHGLRGIVLPTL